MKSCSSICSAVAGQVSSEKAAFTERGRKREDGDAREIGLVQLGELLNRHISKQGTITCCRCAVGLWFDPADGTWMLMCPGVFRRFFYVREHLAG